MWVGDPGCAQSGAAGADASGWEGAAPAAAGVCAWSSCGTHQNIRMNSDACSFLSRASRVAGKDLVGAKQKSTSFSSSCKANLGPRASDGDSLADLTISCAPRTFSLRTHVGQFEISCSPEHRQMRSTDRARTHTSGCLKSSPPRSKGGRRGRSRRGLAGEAGCVVGVAGPFAADGEIEQDEERVVVSPGLSGGEIL